MDSPACLKRRLRRNAGRRAEDIEFEAVEPIGQNTTRPGLTPADATHVSDSSELPRFTSYEGRQSRLFNAKRVQIDPIRIGFAANAVRIGCIRWCAQVVRNGDHIGPARFTFVADQRDGVAVFALLKSE